MPNSNVTCSLWCRTYESLKTILPSPAEVFPTKWDNRQHWQLAKIRTQRITTYIDYYLHCLSNYLKHQANKEVHSLSRLITKTLNDTNTCNKSSRWSFEALTPIPWVNSDYHTHLHVYRRIYLIARCSAVDHNRTTTSMLDSDAELLTRGEASCSFMPLNSHPYKAVEMDNLFLCILLFLLLLPFVFSLEVGKIPQAVSSSSSYYYY